MSVTATLDSFLHNKHCTYDTVSHYPSRSATESALLAAVPLKQVVKAVLLQDHHKHYTLAAVPAMYKVMLPQIEAITGQRLQLADEDEVFRIFGDCAPGAIPALGQAYGINVVCDDALLNENDLYIEAGDHNLLVHLKHEQFTELMAQQPHGEISCAPEQLHDLTHF